uniref:ethanolamine ammonia-lyase subunit EutC n=1 Tax=Faecousia sp. TaxID=2952921 RepID=UPI004029EF25
MNKEELSAMVADILKTMAPEPAVKAAPYRPTAPEPTQQDTAQPDSFVPDITKLDLRRLYLTENPADGPRFLAMKAKTPARLGCGRAGARYKTLTMLRFRADHAAAQDTVFSQVPEDYGASHGFVAVQTRCQSKDQYLTRPDLGRTFDAENLAILQKALPKNPQVQLVIGDGLSSAAILANAADCLAAIQEGLKLRHIECGKPVFVRYCRVGAGDVIGDVTGAKVVCMLVGERPGLVTDKSMSAYITYEARTGVLESQRTVVSNIHAQGTPAVEAGAHIAGLLETVLKKGVSGVALYGEAVG